MANIITYVPTPQADFSNANQLYIKSNEAMQKAIEAAQDTVAYFGKTSASRNDEYIRNLLNDMTVEDWRNPNKKAKMYNTVADFIESTGNNFNPKAFNDLWENIVSARIKEAQEFRDEDAKAREAQEATDNTIANDLVNRLFTGENPKSIVMALSQQTPSVKAKFEKSLTNKQIEERQQGTRLNTTQADYNASVLLPVMNTAKSLVDNLVEVQGALTAEQDPAKQIQLTAQMATARQALDAFLGQYPTAKDAVVGLVDEATARNKKQQQEQLKAAQAYMLEASKVNIAQQNADTSKGELALGALRVEAELIKTKQDAIKDEIKPHNDAFYKKYGVTPLKITSDGNSTVDFPTLRDGLTSVINRKSKELENTNNAQTFEHWLTDPKGGLVYKEMKDAKKANGLLKGLETKWEAALKEVKSLKATNQEKKEIMKQVATGDITFNNWLSIGDEDKIDTAITAGLEKIRLSNQSQKQSLVQAETLGYISQLAGILQISNIDVLNQLYGGKPIPQEVAKYLDPSTRDTYKNSNK